MTDPSSADVPSQPLEGTDASVSSEADAAQREWDGDAVEGQQFPDDARPVDESEVPGVDQPPEAVQPETQGEEPIEAELGDEGQGDLAPEDLA